VVDSLKFGTSGLRGLATDLVGPVAYRYTAAFLAQLRESGGLGGADSVLIGRDLRESSPAIAQGVAAAVAAAGLVPRDCGTLPTPALALAAIGAGLPAVMVTGSHIPADRNGLKFYGPSGEITKEDEADILAHLEHVDAGPSGDASLKTHPEALAGYLARCRLFLREGALLGRRIGVWQHSGVLRDELPRLLASFGADAIPLGREEGFRALDTEALGASDAALIAGWVGEHGLDALVSTDGDADRPLLADETGAVIRGDLLGILTARYLAVPAVATPVTSTSAVESAGFRTVVRTRVGSPYVIAGMEKAKLSADKVIGFEANGGVLLGTPMRLDFHTIAALPTRDAMLPILAVLGLAQQTGRTLSGLVGTLPPRFARSGRLENVPPERSRAFVGGLDASFFSELGEVAAIGNLDGVRATLRSGDVVHFRASGNAPEMRCYTEAATPERADALLAWGVAAAERAVRG
jgi:phosphomannomutase